MIMESNDMRETTTSTLAQRLLHALLLVTLLTTVLPVQAQKKLKMSSGNEPDSAVVLSIEERRRLDSIDAATMAKPFYIFSKGRAYDDRLVVRWAPSDYVPFRFLRDTGYEVYRMATGSKEFSGIDSLGRVKPWSPERFKQQFQPEDTLAGVALQLLYGQSTTINQTEQGPGTLGGMMQVGEEQQSVVGMAMMVAELRPDLAEAMGLMYVDRDVHSGVTYTYFVKSPLPDSVLYVLDTPTEFLKLGEVKRDSFPAMLTDTIGPPNNVVLSWGPTMHSAYDIERRVPGGQWKQLNERPYVSMSSSEETISLGSHFTDHPERPGIYEYRVRGYDSFGEKSLFSDPLRIKVPDMIAPDPPFLKRIRMAYPDSTHATAFLFIEKDSIEADFVGYMPQYYNAGRFNGEWHNLFDKPQKALRDSILEVDVSGLPTGDIMIAAVDTAGNYGHSVPMMIRIADYIPPSPPTNLRANVAPDGFLVLRWDASPEDDVHFYEVYSANDSTHVFMNQSSTEQVDTFFVDSLAQGLNQAYIYYKVKAVDWSGNASGFSQELRVLRPNYIPPSTCRADSIFCGDDEIFIDWIQSSEIDLDYHRIFRKLDTDEEWTLLAVCNADSARAHGNHLRMHDSPPPHMRTRYVYAVETFNLTGVGSGLSQMQTFLFTGPRIVEVPLKLTATYHAKEKETRLAWETGKVPDYGPWYYCVFRKGPDDDAPKFLLSVSSSEQSFQDNLLRGGQRAEYYITVQYDDGRRSQPSNTASVVAPPDKQQ